MDNTNGNAEMVYGEDGDPKDSKLEQIEEDKDNVIIGENVEEEDTDPMNASNISTDDPMNSSAISLGTAALENAMASIIATNDAAYGISPITDLRRGISVSKNSSTTPDVHNTTDTDSLHLGIKQPLNNNASENNIVAEELSDIDINIDNHDMRNSPFKRVQNSTTSSIKNPASLDALEDEIWKEHLALQKLGLF